MMVEHRLPAVSLYLVFFSLLVISWTPGGVSLLPIPVLLVTILMYRSQKDERFSGL
jgi:hypothetical protein